MSAESEPPTGEDGPLPAASPEAGPSCIVPARPEQHAYRRVADVAVGLDPEGVVVHAATGLAYVACSRSDCVSVVDLDAFEVVSVIEVGGEPIDIAVDEESGRIFTADARDDQVSVIDATLGKVVTTIPVGCYPAGLCLDARARRLYCGDAIGSTLSVIDVDRLERVAVCEAELGAGAVAADPARSRIYCVNFVASSVTVVDATSLEEVRRVPLSAGPCAVAVNAATGDVFVVESLASTVTRIDAGTFEKVSEARVPNAPVGLTIGRRDDRLYVGNRGDGSVSVLGLDGREWARIPVGTAPGGVCEHPTRLGRILVANAGSGTLTVADDLLDAEPPQRPGRENHPMTGRQMPALSLPDLWTGELRDLGEWAGRKYVINVFASW